MARIFKYPGITLKEEIWICSSKEAGMMRKNGIPYFIISNANDEEIAKAIVYAFALKRYPNLLIEKPPRTTLKIEVLAEPREDHEDGLGSCTEENNFGDYIQFTEDGEYRDSAGGVDEVKDISEPEYDKLAFKQFFDPADMTVDMDVLSQLGMLPKFAIDIAEAIKQNLSDYMFNDGYNKKLGFNTGFFGASWQAPNLIILDVSGSIPRGVSSVMVSLIETLCERADADLIITAGQSFFYPKESIPTVSQISHLVGGGNEQVMFSGILETKVLGRHWGNVIVFGDQDCPSRFPTRRWTGTHYEWDRAPGLDPSKLAATKIDRLMSFHTYARKTPGYGLWCHECQLGEEVINIDWVMDMKLSSGMRNQLQSWRRWEGEDE